MPTYALQHDPYPICRKPNQPSKHGISYHHTIHQRKGTFWQTRSGNPVRHASISWYQHQDPQTKTYTETEHWSLVEISHDPVASHGTSKRQRCSTIRITPLHLLKLTHAIASVPKGACITSIEPPVRVISDLCEKCSIMQGGGSSYKHTSVWNCSSVVWIAIA